MASKHPTAKARTAKAGTPTDPGGDPRTMVLTGCASGIGRHMATVLADRGHRLLLTDLDAEAVRALVKEHGWPRDRVRVRKLDVRDAKAWERVLDHAVDTWGSLEVLFNIAGYLKPGYVEATELSDVDLHLDVNVKGVILGTRAAARRMIEQGRGHIVNVASLAGIAAIPGLCLYSASKHAARGFSLAAAQSLRQHGVAVTVICPDAVETPMLELQVDYEEAAMTFSGPRPLTVEDVEEVLTRALEDRPLEVAFPPSRAWMARLVNTVPEMAAVAAPLVERAGRAAQRKRSSNSSV